jgi:hypothetical protein
VHYSYSRHLLGLGAQSGEVGTITGVIVVHTCEEDEATEHQQTPTPPLKQKPTPSHASKRAVTTQPCVLVTPSALLAI